MTAKSIKNGDEIIYGIDQQVVFSGHYYLQVLRGTVTISASSTLHASTNRILVSCPSPPYYSIKPTFNLSETDLVPEVAKGLTAGCVISIRPLDLSPLGTLAPPFQTLFPKSVQKLSLSISPDQLWTYPHSWSELVSGLGTNGERIAVLGPKNSGKSSLCRYIINKKASASSPVYLLDLDPGQCEFCPPGTLSLVKLESPHFATSYMHCNFKNVVKAHTFGWVSPIENLGRYLDLCADLIRCVPDEGLLVVNTPGWTKGLGIELIAEITRISGAQVVTYMGKDESYEELQENFLETINLEMTLLEIPDKVVSKFSSSELRTLQTMAYFHRSDSNHITQWAPYELDLDPSNRDGSAISGLCIIDPNEINPADYRTVFEGAIVGIVQLENIPQPLISESHAPLIPLEEPGETKGYGIIQSFSDDNRVRLLTPMDPDILDHHVVLVRGRLEMPLWEIWDQKASNGPWLLPSAPPGIGSVYTRFRRNLGRK